MQIARVIHVVYKVGLNKIALMTPYRAQKDHIKKLVIDAGLLAKGLTVTTITESQGTYAKIDPMQHLLHRKVVAFRILLSTQW